MRPRSLLLQIMVLCVVLAGAGPARADVENPRTLVVDQQAGPYRTIADAVADAMPTDVIAIHAGTYEETVVVTVREVTLRGEPGTTITSAAPFAVSLLGYNDQISGLRVVGSQGGVHVESASSWHGVGAGIFASTIVARDRALDVAGDAKVSVWQSLVRVTDPSATAIRVSQTAPAPAKLVFNAVASIVVGGSAGTGLDVQTGTPGDATQVGTAEAHLTSVTVAGGAPTAVHTARTGLGGAATVFAYNTILHGAGDVTGTGNERSASDAATFLDAAALDFHLRADAPALRVGDMVPLSEPQAFFDYDGVPVPVAMKGASAGALSFRGQHPVAQVAGPAAAESGRRVTFDASKSSSPNVGGTIASYVWRFGDGSADATTTTPSVQHVFTRPGLRTVTVRVVDNVGFDATSAPLALTVTDTTRPIVTITSPAGKARLRSHKVKVVRGRHGKRSKRSVVNVLKFAGAVTDAGGVRTVQVAVHRPSRTGRKCVFLDGAHRRMTTRACSSPPPARASVDDGAWSWHTPARLALPAGSWTLTVRATDQAGNVGTSVLHFTVT